MSLQDLLPIIFERFGAFQTLWNLYIVIVLGVIGFIVSAKIAMSSKIVRTVLIIGFIAFALVNLRALSSVHKQRIILIDLASKRAVSENNPSVKALVEAGRPDEAWKVWAFHLAADGVLVLLIWFVPIYRLKCEIDA